MIDCWTLQASNWDWKAFWFNENNEINWKMLGLDDNAIKYINKIDSSKQLNLATIREACPIKLDKKDSNKDFSSKINDYITEQYSFQKMLVMMLKGESEE